MHYKLTLTNCLWRNKMLYIHENNLLGKIASNYKGHKQQLEHFYQDQYLPVKRTLESISFSEDDNTSFL